MPTPGGNFAESWILRLRHVTGVFWVSGQVHRHLGICLAHQVEWEASHARTQLFRLFSAGWTWSIVSALLSFSNALGCTGIYANRKEKNPAAKQLWLCFGWHSFVLWHHRTESRLGLYSLGSCGWLHPSPGFWDYRSELPICLMRLQTLYHLSSILYPNPKNSIDFMKKDYMEVQLGGGGVLVRWGGKEVRGGR